MGTDQTIPTVVPFGTHHTSGEYPKVIRLTTERTGLAISILGKIPRICYCMQNGSSGLSHLSSRHNVLASRHREAELKFPCKGIAFNVTMCGIKLTTRNNSSSVGGQACDGESASTESIEARPLNQNVVCRYGWSRRCERTN